MRCGVPCRSIRTHAELAPCPGWRMCKRSNRYEPTWKEITPDRSGSDRHQHARTPVATQVPRVKVRRIRTPRNTVNIASPRARHDQTIRVTAWSPNRPYGRRPNGSRRHQGDHVSGQIAECASTWCAIAPAGFTTRHESTPPMA